MKILYLTQSQIPSRSANSIHVMSMANAFARNKNEIHVLTQNNRKIFFQVNDIYEYYNIEKSNFLKIIICKLPSNGFLRELLYFFRIIILLTKNRYDMIYSRNIYGSYLLSLIGFKTILELHSPPQKLSKIFFKKIIKKNSIKFIISISQNLEKYIKKKFFLNGTPIKVIRDAANIINPKGSNFLKKQFEIKKNSIGYIGGLFKGRGIDLIIKLAKRCKNNNFYIIGGSEDEIEFWKKQNISPNIYFIGYLNPQYATKLAFAFDILIAPYQDKVFVHGSSLKRIEKNTLETSKFMSPLKIFEYMATKKPIICSKMPVLNEFLENNYNSLLCNSKKIEEWEKAIKKLTNNTRLRKYITKNAYQDLIKKYTWDNRSKKIINFNLETNKILIFNANLDGGGAENVITIISNNLIKTRNNVLLALANKKGEYVSFLNKKVKIINFNKSRTVYCFFQLMFLIIKYKPDILFSTIINSNLISILLKQILFFLKFKVIIRESNHLSKKLNNKIFANNILRILSKRFYKKSDFIISPTKIILNDLKKNFFVPKNKILEMSNPVEIAEIKRLSKIKLVEKIPKNYLISIGRLTYQKNYEFLINAFYHFQKKVKNCDLLILGQGPDKDMIINNINKLGINKKVKLLGYKKNPFNYLKKAKLLVLTSRWEGYPNVLVQGMVLNKKIIASECYGSSKAVLGSNGTIVKSKDPLIFAKAMSKVYNKKTFYKKYKQINKINLSINKFLKIF